jgi:hypothetical protein
VVCTLPYRDRATTPSALVPRRPKRVPPTPLIPTRPRLEHVKYAKHSQVYSTGRSSWGSAQPACENALPPFYQQLQISVVSRNPIPLSIPATPEPGIRWASWFAQDDQNYLPMLILAWAYILSARWAEIMPEGASLGYTSSMADDSAPDVQATLLPESPSPVPDIGDASPDEAR